MQRARDFFKSTAPVKWLFYGDSITHGALHTFGMRDYTELFAERVRVELGRTMDIVINTAINGDSTPGLLRTFDWRVEPFKPDVVFVMIGMNDCSAANGISADDFERNLAELYNRIDELGALTVLQTTCPILPGTAPEREPEFDDFMERVRRVAAEKGVPLIDHLRYWQAHPDQHFFWMSNAFHPNAHGHQAFAIHLFEALDIFDAGSPTCRLFLP